MSNKEVFDGEIFEVEISVDGKPRKVELKSQFDLTGFEFEQIAKTGGEFGLLKACVLDAEDFKALMGLPIRDIKKVSKAWRKWCEESDED